MSRRIAVIGGGISGLVAAREMARLDADAQVIVFEGSDRLGGKVNRVRLTRNHHDTRADDHHVDHDGVDHDGVDQDGVDQGSVDQDGGADAGPAHPAEEGADTANGDGLTVDTGAESLLIRRPEALQLINELGLDDHLSYPTGAKPSVLVNGDSRRLPPTVMGVPTDLDALGDHLSAAGLERARQEPQLPAPGLNSDIGIGEYTDQRFGPEVTDRLLEPMLSGVYAGQSRSLSFEAVHPALFDAARHGGSLLGHAQQVAAATRRDDHGPAQPAFAGLHGGIGSLVNAVAKDLERRGVTIRSNTTVRSIRRMRDGRFELVSGPVPRPETLTADRVLVATPATAAARLLTGLAPDAAQELSGIPYASTALIAAVVTDAEISGSGLLVPPGELDTIKAFTHSANKWDWVATACSRVFGPDATVVRISIGRYGGEPQLQVSDRELADRTLTEARKVPGWARARVLRAVVQRWGGGLPQYLVGHRGRVARLQDAVAGIDGLTVTGSYLDGPGVPACIAAAQRAAAAVLG